MSDDEDELNIPITWPMGMEDMERFIALNAARDAIVEAADALRSEVDGECVALFARRQDELFRAVDAWRKLRDAR